MSVDPTLPGEPGPADATLPADTMSEGGTVGPYRILQRIGEGGMGEVYVAEQTSPIRRQVALKVIKRGMDSRQVVARFQAERQALALMNHRCIAKVHDAGETPGGRPYIAMEYVKGVPINTYADARKLDLRARLELFVQVCEGVQHAHQKAVIHRDLKPSNVLVTEEDGQPVPKIIDFGVAKATSQRLTDMTMFTQVGNIVGTLEYMSPEQADLTGEDVDTRTDVYSLGAILYELLAGALPFDSRELRAAGFDEMRRIIREIDPPRPSTRLRTLADADAATVLASRSTELGRWTRALKGDIDWICLKALAKERHRRYDSPLELAADVRRAMNDEPVAARPPSTAYRVRKFVRRNRTAVAAAAVVAVALVAGVATMSWGLWRATRAEALARAEAERANLEAETSHEVTEFLIGLFEQANPHTARGEEITARRMLDLGSERIGTDLADRPALQARLKTVMGRGYRDMGVYEPATRLLEDAVATMRREGLGETVETAGILEQLGYLYVFTARYAEAERAYGEAIALRRELHGDTSLELADALQGAAFVHLRARSKLAQADTMLDEAIAIYESLELGDDWGHASALMHKGWVLVLLKDDPGALGPHRAALDMRRRLADGGDHPSIAWSLQHLTHIHVRLDRVAEAERFVTEARAMNLRIHGEWHPEVAYNHMAMGLIHEEREQWDGAREDFETAVAIFARIDPEGHPEACTALNRLAVLAARAGDATGAAGLLDRSRRIIDTKVPDSRNFDESWEKTRDEVARFAGEAGAQGSAR